MDVPPRHFFNYFFSKKGHKIQYFLEAKTCVDQ